MKTRRYLTAAMILVIAVGLAGCGSVVSKKWSASFVESYDEIEYWGKYEQGEPGVGEWFMDDDGLYMSEMVFFGPYSFSGDFTMKVRFDSAADAESPVEAIDICVSDGSGVPCSSAFGASFENFGDPDTDALRIMDLGGGEAAELKTEYELPPGNGLENELILVKRGDNYKLDLNGRTIYDGTILRYDSDLFVPTISIRQYKVHSIIIKSVTVDYYGDAVDMGYI